MHETSHSLVLPHFQHYPRVVTCPRGECTSEAIYCEPLPTHSHFFNADLVQAAAAAAEIPCRALLALGQLVYDAQLHKPFPTQQ